MFSNKISKRINEIRKQNLAGIALMGSYSRNEAGRFSDIDIECFTNEEDKEPEVSIIDNKLLVISYANIEEVKEWFTNPKFVVELIHGVRNLIPIWDPSGYLIKIKEKAINLNWTTKLQDKANIQTRKELVSLIEEVNKGIQGNISKDIGRQLNCVLGMSFGLFKIISIQKGIFIKGDNTLFDQVFQVYEKQNDVKKMMNSVFGISPNSLNERVLNGLELYKIISFEFINIFKQIEKEMILDTIKSINQNSK